MPLVSILGELKKAQKGHYAIPLYDTLDSQFADGEFLAAEEKRAPFIIAMYPALMDLPNASALAAYIRERAARATVPVSLMLDHGGSFAMCMKAIKFGFTDVMYDGSKLPVEENIANTREIVRVAHAMGIAVEAEIGHVGQGSEYQEFGSQRKGFTDPATAVSFVAETGVDFLAVAIGSAHGLYVGEPHLDIDLLRMIRSRVDVPLVLHGGSGTGEEQFRAVIAAGIAKINVMTDLVVNASQRMVEASKAPKAGWGPLLAAGVAGVKERCCYHFDLFGTSGKA